MKIRMTRTHVIQPVQYESVTLVAGIEIDTESDDVRNEQFEGLEVNEIGEEMSAILDDLLEPDVTRTLKAGGNRIDESHVWDFYKID